MDSSALKPDTHHYLGIEMNQQVWTLLGQEARTERDDRRMEHFALASLYHWTRSHKYAPINAQRGHWLLARVYAVLERGDDALGHAERCMALTVELALSDFDRAYAHEGIARAHAAAGQTDQAKRQRRAAREAGDAIAKAEDKTLFMSDLASPPWFGVEPDQA